jgi:PIN domain nuclease of toxin-antitoxin system
MAIFDAAPLVAVLLGEAGGLATGRMLSDTDAGHAVCALNAAEVVDRVSRGSGEPAENVAVGMELWFEAALRCVPLDWTRACRAAELRARHYHRTRSPVTLADCGAIALAEQIGTELVTSDGPMLRLGRELGIDVIAVPDSSGRTPK